MPLTVAILGRPNVGKSTLYNRLVGRRAAIVDPTPGVTRDWREGEARIGPLRFTVLDTAGLEEAEPETLLGRMQRQTASALAAADVGLLVVDARAGITPADLHFARTLRRQKVPILLVANKAESGAARLGLAEAFELGLGEPIAVSAEHGLGMDALYDALAPLAAAKAEREGEADDVKEDRLDLAIVGRPNVGKSTLMNRLLGHERVLTGPEPGVTRDPIAATFSHRGRAVRLVDTAGMRRRAHKGDMLEHVSVLGARRALEHAEVVVLVIDATQPLEKQDLAIASSVEEEGRALVIAANKWDAVPDRAAAMRRVRAALEDGLAQLKGVKVVTISALTGRGVERLMPAVLAAYDVWNTRLPTARLNRWLAKALEDHPPPIVGGRRLKVRYLTQLKGRPPTFVAFANRPENMPDSYRRYLVNRMREELGLPGTPIRLSFRGGDNPYAEREA